MNIAHIAPYGPNCAGIYEAARDMLRADILQGHNAFLVDAGAQPVNAPNRNEPQVGAIDDRAGFALVTSPPASIDGADVIMLHTGCPDHWVVWNQAPIIMVVHGTPVASFRTEERGNHQSYSVYASGAKKRRVKALLYFWPEFEPYWDVIFPEGKGIALAYPPIDRERFSPEGEVWDIPRYQRGQYNVLIADSWRDDSDVLEILHGAIEAAKRVQGLTFHLLAIHEPLGPYGHIVRKLRSLGALGALGGRFENMEQVYRAHDFVLSGRRSISRVIAEALCCGTPVIADQGCTAANATADKRDPLAMASVIEQMVVRLENDRGALRRETATLAESFDLDRYGKRMTALYERVVEE